MKNRPIYLFLGTALGLYATPVNADWCYDNSDDLDYVISWYNDYYAAFQNKEITYNEFKLNDMASSTCTAWSASDVDGNPLYNASCNDWDDESLAGDACARRFAINSSDHNQCWRILTERDSCDSGGDEGGGGPGSGESCGVYTAMNGAKYYDSADTCYVPSTEYFFTSQGHKYHFKSNCWWSS